MGLSRPCKMGQGSTRVAVLNDLNLLNFCLLPLEEGQKIGILSSIFICSRELEGGSPLQEFDKKSRNILPKFGILIENLPNDSCILTGDFDRFFKRSDRFLIRSFMLRKWYHVDPRQTAVTVVPFPQHKAPD